LYCVFFDFLVPEGREHLAEVLRLQERVGSEPAPLAYLY